MTPVLSAVEPTRDPVATTVVPPLDTVAAMVEVALDAIAATIQARFDPVALFVQMTLDAIALAIQTVGELGFALGSRFFSARIETIIDAIAFGIEVVVDPVPAVVQPIVDPVAARVEPVVDAITAVIQSPVDAVAAPAEIAVVGKNRQSTAKSQHAESDYDCFFHRHESPFFPCLNFQAALVRLDAGRRQAFTPSKDIVGQDHCGDHASNPHRPSISAICLTELPISLTDC
jgi:hypothetical protein